MSLARREQQALWQIDREFGRSASWIHAAFCEFNQACAGQAMPRQERVMHRWGRSWCALRKLLAAAVFVTVVVAGGGLDHARQAVQH